VHRKKVGHDVPLLLAGRFATHTLASP
jgi:hypothetical protein